MEIELYPHQVFNNDFNKIIDEARRQEEVNSGNRGELRVARSIHNLIASEVGPLIESSDWIYEGALRFAEELAPQYFNRLRLTGEQTVRYNNQLHSTNNEVVQLLAELSTLGKVSVVERIDLTKASDFSHLIDYSILSKKERLRVDNLCKRIKQHEILQLTLTLDAISNLYEMGLPRVMFVIRRALKVKLGKSQTLSDDELHPPSNYIDWIRGNLASGHILKSHFAADKPRIFYRTARNVANHHKGLEFDPNNNMIRLVDKSTTLEIPLYEFQQRYRYLVYLVDYSVRGILYYFTNIERGYVSVKVCHDYESTFPSGLLDLTPRQIKAYD